MNYNSAIWAVLLCVSAHQHHVPFLGIQPSNVPTIGSLEQMLVFLDPKLPYKVVADALGIAAGGVLIQDQSDGPRPITFIS